MVHTLVPNTLSFSRAYASLSNSGSVTFLRFWVHVGVSQSALLSFTGLMFLSVLPSI